MTGGRIEVEGNAGDWVRRDPRGLITSRAMRGIWWGRPIEAVRRG